jgi:hypothetical protein
MKYRIILFSVLSIALTGIMLSGSKAIESKPSLMNVINNSHVGGALSLDTTIDWKGMSHGQRMEYMKKVVFPKMKALFVKFDATRFAAMDCRTCHGSAANDDSFKMPNPEIWKMPKGMDGWKMIQKNNPKYMEFMGKTVKPQMAALLGMQPSNPQAQVAGFGCDNCHTGD